jgi:NADH:ubiquinone oxidoreductase subunit 4 (subunit M)
MKSEIPLKAMYGSIVHGGYCPCCEVNALDVTTGSVGQPKTLTIPQLSDLSIRELVTVIPLAILILWIGLYPGPLMEMMDSSVTNLVQHMAQYRTGMPSEVALR